MSREQSAAYLMAQVQLCETERQQMLAANRERQDAGLADAYGPEQWADFLQAWEAVLGHNPVMQLFLEATDE